MEGYDLITAKVVDGVMLVELCHAPHNMLNVDLVDDLINHLTDASYDDSVKGVVISGRELLPFSYGVDMKDITSIKQIQQGGFYTVFRDLIDTCRQFEKPIVAAIESRAYSVGLELCLLCHYKVASEHALFCFPEVNYGMVPGGGGTQIAPRLIGLNTAVELICSGRIFDAVAAKQNGLIDEIVPVGQSAKIACKAIKKFIENKKYTFNHRWSGVVELNGFDQEFKKSHLKVSSMGKDAPLAAFDCIMQSTTHTLDDGLDIEEETFIKQVGSDQAQALRYLYFSERIAHHIPGLKLAHAHAIHRVMVMGGGDHPLIYFLESCVSSGMEVYWVCHETHAHLLDKVSLSAQQVENYIHRVVPSDLHAVPHCDLVMRAVDDLDMDQVLKQWFNNHEDKQVFLLDSATQCVHDLDHRPRFNIHYFGRDFARPMIQINYHKGSQDQYLAQLLSFTRSADMISLITMRSSTLDVNPFFWSAMIKELVWQLMHGVRYDHLTEHMNTFGFTLTPAAYLDQIRLESTQSLLDKTMTHHGTDWRYGSNFDDVMALIQSCADEQTLLNNADHIDKRLLKIEKLVQLNTTKKNFLDVNEGLDRLVHMMIDQAVHFLDQGVTLRGSDMDVLMVNAFGFPAHLGGPLWYADKKGLEVIYKKICAYQANDKAMGFDHWVVSPLWERLIDGNKRLSQYQTYE
ncbi:MAG: enoyl-CoA hydratase-related protein [Pseudomonadota bacterium]|nr:enoyl-CoA hydratase-related protein [Pseudomonadota bacterium]